MSESMKSEERFWRELRARVDGAVGGGALSLDEAEARMAVAGEEPVDPAKVAAAVRAVVAVERVVREARGRGVVRVLRWPYVRAAAVVLGVALAAAAIWYVSTPSDGTYARAIETLLDPRQDPSSRQSAAMFVWDEVQVSISVLKAAAAEPGEIGSDAAARIASIVAAFDGRVKWSRREVAPDLRMLAKSVTDMDGAAERRRKDVAILGEAALHGVLSLQRVELAAVPELSQLARAWLMKLEGLVRD